MENFLSIRFLYHKRDSNRKEFGSFCVEYFTMKVRSQPGWSREA